MRRSYDARRTRFLDSFLTLFRQAALRERPRLPVRELEDFGLVQVAILQEVLAEGWAGGAHGGRLSMPSLIAENLSVSVKTVRRHLLAAARAGFIKGVSAYDRATQRQAPLELILNPAFVEAAEKHLPQTKLKPLCEVFAAMWVSRLDYDGSVQGFRTICRWGRDDEAEVLVEGGEVVFQEEVVSGPDGETGRRLVDMPKPSTNLAPRIRDWHQATEEAREGKAATRKREREADRLQLRVEKDEFVAGAAVVWQTLQARVGRGHQPPAWSGERSTLPTQQRRERDELEKTFELYGGVRTALAWAVFNGGRPIKDKKDRLVFSPEHAHRQWTTPDKKPSHFAKHINLVFDELASIGFAKDTELVERLRSVFGKSFDAPPRSKAMGGALAAAGPSANPLLDDDEPAAVAGGEG